MIIETSLDMLENGTVSKLSAHLTSLTQTFLALIKNRLAFGPESDIDPNTNTTTFRNPKCVTIPTRLVKLPSFLLSPASDSQSPPPSPIVPLLTPTPHSLSAFLAAHYSIVARPITYPTVPKGENRLRVCLHAGNSYEEVERLVQGIEEWVAKQIKEERGEKHHTERVQAAKL
jgi:8-amino-7-oxononanoate synthase